MDERVRHHTERFAGVVDEVVAFVERCPAGRWHAVTEAEGWTVAAVCRHIARGFEVHPQLLRMAAEGEPLPTTYTWEAVHESNGTQAQDWAACSKAEVIAALRRYGNEGLAVLRSLSDDQLRRVVEHPLDHVPVTVEQSAEGMIDHPGMHLPSLRATATPDHEKG